MSNQYKEVGKYYWAYLDGKWEPVKYSLVYNNRPCFYKVGHSFAHYFEDYPDLEWGLELDYSKVNADLVNALQWYIDNDETNDSKDNEFYLEGRRRAEKAVKTAIYSSPSPNLKAIPYEPGERESHCKTCESCGDSGCCSPGRCIQVKCLYGEYAVNQYEENSKDVAKYYDILIALGFYDPLSMTVGMAEKIGDSGRNTLRWWEIEQNKNLGIGHCTEKDNEYGVWFFVFKVINNDIVINTQIYGGTTRMILSKEDFYYCQCDQPKMKDMVFKAREEQWEGKACMGCGFVEGDPWVGVTVGNINEEG